MLKFQIALIAVLIGCIGFVACERTQTVLEPVMMGTMEMVMEMDAYKSWASVDLPAPEMTVPEAAAAMNPAGTGQAHGTGTRTVYFNEDGAMANMAGTAYPAGTMIVKEVMNADNTAVVHVATMMKTDDPMYAAHNGWVYGTPQPMTVENSVGCHDCHAKAGENNDSVFVSLSMNGDGAGDTNGDGAGDTNGDGAGDTNGDGAGN